MEDRLSVLIKGGKNPSTISFDWSVGPVQNKNQPVLKPMDLKITNEQQIPVTLTPVTDTGKPAKLDGAPVWSVTSGDSTLIVAGDGLSATLVSSDTPGDTAYLVTADADLGSGVETISDTINLTVTGANAKNLGITSGPPEAKPAAKP
jgi:hypothetical protein